MNPLWYFAQKEREQVRRDVNEGVTQNIQPDDVKWLSIQADGKTTVFGPERLRGPVRFSDGRDASFNIFCMTAITNQNASIPFDDRLRTFGNAFAAIYNVSEFVSRFLRGLRGQGIKVRHGLVRYVDDSVYSGDWGAFTKSCQFEFQREYRFALVPGTGTPLIVELGSLEDICAVGTELKLPTGPSICV